MNARNGGMTAVKERPILFKPDMVRALLDGRKTMTRRIMKDQPVLRDGWLCTQRMTFKDEEQFKRVLPELCPHGVPGDRLYVRETWARGRASDFIYYRATDEDAVAAKADRWRSPIHMPRTASRITLEVTDVRCERLQEISERDCMAEGVREYLYRATGDHPDMIGYITDADGPDENGTAAHHTPQEAFAKLWDSINGPGAWERNDWVWVVQFRHLQGQ